MLLKLNGLLSVIFLLVLLPQSAQSIRSRFATPHAPRTHHKHPPQHHASSSQSSHRTGSQHELFKPHIQMVTALNEKHSQYANFNIAMATVEPHALHQVPELGGMLDTPVSGPNPGGNLESLAMSRQNLLGDMLDTPVSGPNPGGNSESLLVSAPSLGGSSNTIIGMLDTPVSGPSPSGNSNTLGNMLDTPGSGPNPSGNSQGLFATWPNARLNSAKGLASRQDNMMNTPISGPNAGTNSATLGDMLDTAVSGPYEDSESLAAIDGQVLSDGKAGDVFSVNAGPIGLERDHSMLSASSGPNPGGNSATLGSNLSKKFAQVATLVGSTKATGDTLFEELPRTPVPPSGPSPAHNSAATNQGLFAGRSLRGSIIGCEQEGEGDSGRLIHHSC